MNHREERLVRALERLVDNEPCSLDHHGFCQAHGVSAAPCAMAQAREALLQSEERYRRLFQNQHIVMLIIDPQSGAIVDANPAAVGFYGWSHDELCGMNIKEINILAAEEVKAEMQKAKQLNCIRFSFRHRLARGTISSA